MIVFREPHGLCKVPMVGAYAGMDKAIQAAGRLKLLPLGDLGR